MKALFFGCIVLLFGCDNRQAIHQMHPSLERMQIQPRVDPFDARGMSTPPRDTVARDDLEATAASEEPPKIDEALLRDGRASFDRTCAPCHGVLGDGDSVIASKMMDKRPPSLLEGDAADLPQASVLATIERGKGFMPSLAHELTPRERWATIDYLAALRLSRRARVSDLPADVQRELAENAGAR